MTGHIRPHSLQALKLISINGPSTAAELDALDPENGDHKHIIKVLEQGKFVVSDLKTRPKGEPTRYSLTLKARNTLQGKAQAQPQAKASRGTKTPKSPTVTPSVTYGASTTGRMVSPCADMLAPATRRGAEQALQIPSRVNDVLHYRDGRVAPVNLSTNH